jgi:hypothetical protein
LKESVPKANELNRLKERQNKNYIKDNLNKAVFELKPPSRPEKPEDDLIKKRKDYGKIPTYINKYKEQRENEAMQKLEE